MTSIVPSLCNACARLRSGRATCDAYPGGIPQDMLTLAGDHHAPRPGDHGLRFELAPGADAAEKLDLWQRMHDAA